MARRMKTLAEMEAWVIIHRCVHTRGQHQLDALAELDYRRLWLSPQQKIAADLVDTWGPASHWPQEVTPLT